MDEQSFITRLVKNVKRCETQLNGTFDSDAELVRLGDMILAINIDEYSPDEDYFKSTPAETLGWNLVIATISDLLATGASPRYFLHVIGLGEDMNEVFLEQLMNGIESALRASNAHLLGGDISRSKKWRYVGNALGIIEDGPPVSRKLSSEKVLLYATGSFGDGNLSAMVESYQPYFESRYELVRKMRPFITVAMDTSDGFRNTLLTLSRVNPAYRFVVDSSLVPIHPEAIKLTSESLLPPEAFLYGSAGEYELIFGIPAGKKADFESLMKEELSNGILSGIGHASLEHPDRAGLFWRSSKFEGERADIPLSIDPRLNSSRESYIKELLQTVSNLFYR